MLYILLATTLLSNPIPLQVPDHIREASGNVWLSLDDCNNERLYIMENEAVENTIYECVNYYSDDSDIK